MQAIFFKAEFFDDVKLENMRKELNTFLDKNKINVIKTAELFSNGTVIIIVYLAI